MTGKKVTDPSSVLDHLFKTMDIIDERIYGSSRHSSPGLSLSFLLPASLAGRLTLFLALALCSKFLIYDHLLARYREARAQRRRRRNAGIPDSDTRPWAVASRNARKKKEQVDRMRARRSSASGSESGSADSSVAGSNGSSCNAPSHASACPEA